MHAIPDNIDDQATAQELNVLREKGPHVEVHLRFATGTPRQRHNLCSPLRSSRYDVDYRIITGRIHRRGSRGLQ